MPGKCLLPCMQLDDGTVVSQGKQYWADERRLCKAMLSHSQVQAEQPPFDLEDVHKTSEAKSFDYRASSCGPP